jgi:hypothetical protein
MLCFHLDLYLGKCSSLIIENANILFHLMQYFLMVDLQLAFVHLFAYSKIYLSYDELIQTTKVATVFGIIYMEFME